MAQRGRPFKNAPRTDLEILEAYARTHSMRAVAQELGISIGSVWNHTHDLVPPRKARTPAGRELAASPVRAAVIRREVEILQEEI